MSDATSKEWGDRTCEMLRRMVRENFENDGHLMPIAFVFGTLHPETGERLKDPIMLMVPALQIVGPGENDVRDLISEGESGKEIWTKMIRGAAMKSDAIAIGTATEAWTVSWKPDEYEKHNGGSLKNVPGRREVLTFMWEHASHKGSQCWMAEIVREDPADDQSKMLELKPWEPPPGLESGDTGKNMGRFTDFLPGSGGH